MRRLKDVKSRKNILMFEVTEHLDFSIDPFAGDQVEEDIGHLLECNSFSISRICHGPVNHAKQSI